MSSICKEFYLISKIDTLGNECIIYLDPEEETNFPLLTYSEIVSIDSDITKPYPQDIFCST